MRRAGLFTAVLVSVGLGLVWGPWPCSHAQSPFLGASPRAMQFKPVDTSKAVGTLNTSSMLHSPKIPSPLNLTNLFHKPTQPSWPPKFAATPMIAANKNPFQPNLPTSRYIIPPTPPGPKSKSIWDFPFNPFKKSK